MPGSSVNSSADGTRLAAAGSPGRIYFSEDSGVTWTLTSAASNSWPSIVCSADGNAWLALDSGHKLLWKSQSTPAPLLGAASIHDNLVLSWTVPSVDLILQQNSDLSMTNWMNVEGTPVLNLTNLQNQIMLSPTNSSGFYRLATP